MDADDFETHADPLRLAAVLLYARGISGAGYAERFRAEALARSDNTGTKFWSDVAAALLELTPLPSTARN